MKHYLCIPMKALPRLEVERRSLSSLRIDILLSLTCTPGRPRVVRSLVWHSWLPFPWLPCFCNPLSPGSRPLFYFGIPLVLEWPQHTSERVGYTMDSLSHKKKGERTRLLSKKKERKSREGKMFSIMSGRWSLLMSEACC